MQTDNDMLHEPFAGGSLPRLDPIIVAGLLLLVAALAWAFTVHQAILMDEMDAAMWRDMNMSMNGMQPLWNAVDAVMLFVMWSAMMAAMMIPGASPMITAFATINRRRRARAAPYVPTAAFLIGYLIVWTGFSVIATALQWLLQANRLLDQCSGFCCLGLTEIAEGDDRRAALVYNVEPDAREGASIIPRRLNLA